MLTITRKVEFDKREGLNADQAVINQLKNYYTIEFEVEKK